VAETRAVSNPLALAVLSYLTQRPMHPYELSRTLRNNGDDRSIKFNHGTLYMVVKQLGKAGLIREQQTSREGQRPERTVYALTDSGRQELHDWLRELIEQPQHEYPTFVAALSLLAALPPDAVIPLLRRRSQRLGEEIAQTERLIQTTLAAGVPELFLIEEQFRVTLLHAETSFVEDLIGRIADPETDWATAWAQHHSQQNSEITATEPAADLR
jgi:DNA-binding PadR family transcriptional regulator